MQTKDRILLISGILLILVALLIRWLVEANVLFWSLLLTGIVIKSIFLYRSLKSGRLKWNSTLVILITGVALVFVSIGLRSFTFEGLVTDLLLYAGIVLKFCFVILLVVSKIRAKRTTNLNQT